MIDHTFHTMTCQRTHSILVKNNNAACTLRGIIQQPKPCRGTSCRGKPIKTAVKVTTKGTKSPVWFQVMPRKLISEMGEALFKAFRDCVNLSLVLVSSNRQRHMPRSNFQTQESKRREEKRKSTEISLTHDRSLFILYVSDDCVFAAVRPSYSDHEIAPLRQRANTAALESEFGLWPRFSLLDKTNSR
jgi:hypothetical protein